MGPKFLLKLINRTVCYYYKRTEEYVQEIIVLFESIDLICTLLERAGQFLINLFCIIDSQET